MTEEKKKQNPGAIRVFVYGTLKRLHYNHYLLEGNNVHDTLYLGRARLRGPWRMLNLGNFPGVQHVPELIKTPTDIYGEVYQIGAPTLDSLDLLEGNGNFFTRQKVPTPFRNAWIYCIPNSKDLTERFQVIENGVWRPTASETRFIAKSSDVEEAESPAVVM